MAQRNRDMGKDCSSTTTGVVFELNIQPVLAAEHMQPSIIRTTCSSKARFKQCVEIFQQLRPEHETALGRVQARPPL
ncbi:hypothetical protein D3C78_1444790 [compost metagenome]